MAVSGLVEEAINRMLTEGSTLFEIEAFIERLPISEEQRSVMWLRAWAQRVCQHRIELCERLPAGM